MGILTTGSFHSVCYVATHVGLFRYIRQYFDCLVLSLTKTIFFIRATWVILSSIPENIFLQSTIFWVIKWSSFMRTWLFTSSELYLKNVSISSLNLQISPTNLLVRDTVTISIVITGISLAIPVSVLLARVRDVDAVILKKVFLFYIQNGKGERKSTNLNCNRAQTSLAHLPTFHGKYFQKEGCHRELSIEWIKLVHINSRFHRDTTTFFSEEALPRLQEGMG